MPITMQTYSQKRFREDGFYPDKGGAPILWSKLIYKRILSTDSTGSLYSEDFGKLPDGYLQVSSEVKTICHSAFAFAKNLKSIYIPDSVQSIEPHAFKECGLDAIEVPYSVSSIGVGAFTGIPIVRYSGLAVGSPWGAGSVMPNDEVDGFNARCYLQSKLGDHYTFLPDASINNCSTQADCDELIKIVSRFFK